MDERTIVNLVIGIVFLFIVLIISFLKLFGVFKKKQQTSAKSIVLNLFIMFFLGAILCILLFLLAFGLICK